MSDFGLLKNRQAQEEYFSFFFKHWRHLVVEASTSAQRAAVALGLGVFECLFQQFSLSHWHLIYSAIPACPCRCQEPPLVPPPVLTTAPPLSLRFQR